MTRNHRKMGFKSLLVLLAAALTLAMINGAGSATIDITVNPGKPTYYIGEQGAIWGNVTFSAGLGGGLIPNALVSLEVDNSNGVPVILRTRTTGSAPAPSAISILSVTPCDQVGNPVYVFTNQTLAYFKVALNNTDIAPAYAEITLNIFDARNVVYEAFTAFKGLLFNGTTTMLISDPIPQDISPGNATAYVNVFSALPSAGGFAYCLEKSTVFYIVGTSPPPLPTQEQPLSGFFNLSFLIDNYQRTRMFRPGNYSVSANCKYQTEIANATATFEVALRGDINRDGTVDIYDAIIMAGHFNEHQPWPHPTIDPKVDLNGDGAIDIYDAIILAANFGRTA
jgi:hypothetical protein